MTNAETLIRKGKRGAAAFVQAECMASKAASAAQSCEVPQPPAHLQALLDYLLNPKRDIRDGETIDWCRWLVGGGQKPEDFFHRVQAYNNTVMCGLVWTANFVAYRCSTCRISQCMSLCAECFHHGNHEAEGHDYNMFKSQAGGACDCGDSSVMRPSGFCSKHGPKARSPPGGPPPELMCVAENVLPKLILRLVQHLREKSIPAPGATTAEEQAASRKENLDEADAFLTLLHEFCNMGSVMRNVIIRCLVNDKIYTYLTEQILSDDSEYAAFMRQSAEIYKEALRALPGLAPPTEYCDCPTLNTRLVHYNFLDELLFWTVRYEFPQKLVCLLLNMLPNQQYKEMFTRAFVFHYSRMSTMLDRSGISDSLSNRHPFNMDKEIEFRGNRVIHVSVQLFSNEELTLRMTESLHLLHIIVFSIKNMMSTVLTNCMLGGQENHKVVDCAKHVMKDHCYWPLVSDLNNVLSHPSIAYRFMEDDIQLRMWFDFLPMFQGMNVNNREMEAHIEFEPSTYYAAFSAELEAAASPMWSLVSHLKDSSTRHLTQNVIRHCISSIRKWLDAIAFTRPEQLEKLSMSFHLPLHRYYSVFVRQAIKYQDFNLEELLPDTKTLHLMMMHPLAVQVTFYEIMCQMWVRNGLQIKGQAMTYIQCHFSNSMVDADLYLLQLCSTRLEPTVFLRTVLERFHLIGSLSLHPDKLLSNFLAEQDQEISMRESALVFLVTLITLRTNLGMSDQELTKQELVTLLCMEDKTHSTLSEQMPEKNGNGVSDDFEQLLREVGHYREPRFEAGGGTMQQGMYAPKSEVWESLYDPIYVLLRAVHRKDYQSSYDRFVEYVQKKVSKTSVTPWPPWRLPQPCHPQYVDPRVLLHSRYAHGLIFSLLYKAVHVEHWSENMTSLSVFLLELALSLPQTEFSGKEVAISTPWLILHEPVDLQYETWFPTDWLSANLRHTVTAIFASPPSTVSQQEATDGMEVDRVSDAGSATESESTPYFVETPTSDAPESNSSPPRFGEHPPPQSAITMVRGGRNSSSGGSSSMSAALVPYPNGTLEAVTSLVLPQQQEEQQQQVTSEIRTPTPLALTAGSSIVPMEVGEVEVLSPPTEGVYRPARNQITGTGHRTVVPVNESIISLLIKLHSRLSGRQDSYTPKSERAKISELAHTTTPAYAQSRIGDGSFFVEKVLDQICGLDPACDHFVKTTRTQLYPNHHAREVQGDQQQEKDEMEAKKRKAKERQAKMMKEFAERQQKFMNQVSENTGGDLGGGGAGAKEDGTKSSKEFYCGNCHQTQPSTLENPIGIVVLLQASSVLGHKHRDNQLLTLPVNEEDRSRLMAVDDYLSTEYESRFEEMSRHFSPRSYLLSVDSGWQGGIYVQSCGHHVHIECHQRYMSALRGTGVNQNSQTLAVEKGEYNCPMCRQLANSVLPIPPDESSPIFRRTASQCAVTVGHEVTSLLKEPAISPKASLTHAMNLIMDHFNKTTYPQYQLLGTDHSVIMFVSSIARTNLELDLVGRGGTLVAPSGAAAFPSPNVPRSRSCFLPLLHVLSIHMKFRAPRPLVSDWCQVSGLWQDEDDRSLLVRENEVPMLLRDTTTLLLHFTLILPVQVDIVYFTCIVRQLYNLCWLQSCLRLACRLPASVRNHIRDQWNLRVRQSESEAYLKVDTVALGLGLVASVLDSTGIYNEDSLDGAGRQPVSNLPPLSEGITLEEMEMVVEEECLNFMRIAALLRHFVYAEPLPEINYPDWEFTRLCQYLGMADYDMTGRVPSGPCLGWLTSPANLAYSWCRELGGFAVKSHLAARKLILTFSQWKQPQLLRLPRNYDSIFQFYYKRICPVCQKVPKDPSVCLLCGQMVCLREVCCKSPTTGEYEAVRHSIGCGAGTVPYLAVNSGTIIVVRGKRACVWGSIYLDSFGEEDRELKRGKPLFLSQGRYQLLETQWLTHRFDHTNRKWIWHRDQL